MASLSIETRRVDELATTTTGSGEDDLLIIRLADGTGTKSIKVKDLRAVLVGNYSTLEKEDKSGIIAAHRHIREALAADGIYSDDAKKAVYHGVFELVLRLPHEHIGE